MTMAKTVADIMVTPVVSCTKDDTLGHARKLMREHNIRHVPVLDESGRLAGVLTHKGVLKQAIKIANKFGMDELERQENKILVGDVMDVEPESVQPQMALATAGRYFLKSKHGCLPVVEEGCLVGILTSADFVRLSVELLER